MSDDQRRTHTDVAKIICDNTSLKLIEENNRLKEKIEQLREEHRMANNMSVTSINGRSLYFSNGHAFAAGTPDDYYDDDWHVDEWLWPQNPPKSDFKMGDILTKGIEIRRGEQIVSCLTPEDIRDHDSTIQFSECWNPDITTDDIDGDSLGCIEIGLDHPSTTSVSTMLYLYYHWGQDGVTEFHDYDEGSLFSFLQENPNIRILQVRTEANKRGPLDNDEDDDEEEDDNEMLDTDDDHEEEDNEMLDSDEEE